MKRWTVLAAAVLVLAGCGSDPAPQVAASAGVDASRTPQASAPPEPGAGESAPPVTASPEPDASDAAPQTPVAPQVDPAETAFCEYLERTAQAQMQVEDPMDFVKLVAGAAQLAPPAVADDAALFARSVRKLAEAIVGDARQSRAANRWLERNDARVRRAEADLEAYTQQACGRPFITGEGT